jgi:glycosyltransferase involved in cell wall biosynthesis
VTGRQEDRKSRGKGAGESLIDSQSPNTKHESPISLTAIILTLNEADHIVDCIHSLAWADEVLVFDSYSDDDTVNLAKAAGARVTQCKFENYAQQRNAALAAVGKTDWVFFVDADERGTPELGQEIRRVIAEKSESGWYVSRHNYIFGKLTKGAGWFPDYQLRLFRYGSVRYERPVHEVAIVDGGKGHLQNPLIHYNYQDVSHFHQVQEKYTLYEAGILHQNKTIPKFYTPFTQPIRHFKWRYLTLGGYRDGLHGLRLSLYMAYYEWVKYRELSRLQG